MLDEELVHDNTFRENLMSALQKAKEECDTHGIDVLTHLIEEIKFRRLGVIREFETFDPINESINENTKRYTYRGFTRYILDSDGSLSLPEPQGKLPTERKTQQPYTLEDLQSIPQYNVRQFSDSDPALPAIIKKRLSTFRVGALM